MISINGFKIIGVDDGYGNIKTANHDFPIGIIGSDTEPLFTGNMLTYKERHYLIGEGHKEFLADKVADDDFYILTLAGVASELVDAGLTEANVCLAVGLPLTWTAAQKAEFTAYLSRDEEVRFTYKKVNYHIRIVGVKVYPQGYAAVARIKSQMSGVNLVADIGNGTMNVLYIVGGRPQQGKMFTEKFGTHQCTLAVREAFMRRTRRELNDAIIDEVFRTGTANIKADDLAIIRAAASEYVADIFRRLREHGYDEDTMTLYITGGGGCLVKHFRQFNTECVLYRPLVRLDLGNEHEKRAADYLKSLKHGEGNRFIVAAVLARIDGSDDTRLVEQLRRMFREEIKAIPVAAATAAPAALDDHKAVPQADTSVLDDLKLFG